MAPGHVSLAWISEVLGWKVASGHFSCSGEHNKLSIRFLTAEWFSAFSLHFLRIDFVHKFSKTDLISSSMLYHLTDSYTGQRDSRGKRPQCKNLSLVPFPPSSFWSRKSGGRSPGLFYHVNDVCLLKYTERGRGLAPIEKKNSLRPCPVSVALFTHYQAVQLSAMTDFVVLNRRTQARIKNCKFFWPERNFFFMQLTCRYCMREFLGRALTALLVV